MNCLPGLHLAAANGHLSIVQSLLTIRKGKKLDVNLENASGETAVSLAAKGNHLAMVKCLFKVKGLKLYEKQVESILINVVERGYFEMAKLIVEEYKEREEREFVPHYVVSWIRRCCVLSTKSENHSTQDKINKYRGDILMCIKTRNTKATVKQGKETTEEIMQDVKEHFDCGICFEEFVEGEVGLDF